MTSALQELIDRYTDDCYAKCAKEAYALGYATADSERLRADQHDGHLAGSPQDLAGMGWCRACEEEMTTLRSTHATLQSALRDLEERVAVAGVRLEAELQTPNDIWADHIREALRWLTDDDARQSGAEGTEAGGRSHHRKEWRLARVGEVAPEYGGHGTWVETNHPAVVDCMGSVPQCAANGCQHRVVTAQLRALPRHQLALAGVSGKGGDWVSGADLDRIIKQAGVER